MVDLKFHLPMTNGDCPLMMLVDQRVYIITIHHDNLKKKLTNYSGGTEGFWGKEDVTFK